MISDPRSSASSETKLHAKELTEVVKRGFDILFAAVALLVFLPLGIPLMILLRLTGEGEVFYRQTRVGIGRRQFGLFKFATMVKNSANIGSGDITVRDDPRVLSLGRVLRKTKLNEVPQILNILLGDMSVVGPRPLTPKNFAYYSEEDRTIIASMRPGLTGIGSIVFRDEESLLASTDKSPEEFYQEEIAPHKAALERWYYSHRSIWTDIAIVFVTAWVVLFPESSLHFRIWQDLPRTKD